MKKNWRFLIAAAALIIVIGVSAVILMNAARNGPMEKAIGSITYINADNQKVTEDIQWNSYYWQVRDEETGELSYKKMGTEALYPVGGIDTVTPGGAAKITFTLEGKVEPDGIYVYKFNNQEFIQGILTNSNPKAEDVVYTTETKGGNKTITFEAAPGYRNTIGVMYGESWVMYVFYVPPEAEPDTTVQLGHIYFYVGANNSVFSFEPVEWVGSNQLERIAELGLDPDDDLPGGFYIYVPPVERTELQVTYNTRYFIVDSSKKPASEFGYKEVGKQEFLIYQDRTPSFASVTPYWVEVEDGYVKVIAQQYLP